MQKLAQTRDEIESLTEAFAAAEYVVEANCGFITIRVGVATPALDRHLDGRSWALITAYNPDGRLCAAEANAAAQRSLERSVRALQPAVILKACNRDPSGRWPDEPAWLFTPKRMCVADRLAQRFGQRAIVVGAPGAPARLRMYGRLHDAPGSAPAVVS